MTEIQFMSNQKPILIASPPRCGTTLLAGLFHKHGAWIGKARVTSYPKTNSLLGTENQDIKKYLKSLLGDYKNWNLPTPTIDNVRGFKEEIEGIVPDNQVWLVKTSNILFTWRLWRNAYPDAIWIFPKRDINKIVDSAMRHPAMKKRGREKIDIFIEALQKRQEFISRFTKNRVFVNVNNIVNDGECKDLIEYVGLEYDQSITDNWINKGMWHG